MKQEEPVKPEEIELYSGLENIPGVLWDDLAGLDLNDVCRRAAVVFREDRGYEVPFLGTVYHLDPRDKSITVPPGARKPGFQVGLVLLNYLINAADADLTGNMVTARELNGGALFFQGPHALSKESVLKRFGGDGAKMTTAALSWGGIRVAAGDAAFKILALPKILVAYTLYERDEEFPAELTITFDASTDRHLPLDSIWALINVMTHRLATCGTR